MNLEVASASTTVNVPADLLLNGLLLRNDVEKRIALEILDLILLHIDEIVDGGIILETYANTIARKVASNDDDNTVTFF
ncbi:hypothetical protein J5N97_009493 [Dioscorea zingiberensis]|uniref:Coatomer subunit zeta n=1 Tax=Dioscorea zingiberensis TaxID=325984 RepID=A0A9D5CXN0_9LILI|nr:hypothetical protein J5N97_009493 [Dioscorea zingiberensis]